MAYNEVFATGLQLNFLPNKTFEVLNASSKEEEYRIISRNLWRALMMGCPHVLDFNHMISVSFLRSVLLSPEPRLLKILNDEFQKGLEYVFKQLSAHPELDVLQRNQAELYVTNCLTYMLYVEPEKNSVLWVPQYIEGAWQMVDYQVDYIELTNPDKKNTFAFSQRDRVFAFGLTPSYDHRLAHPLLIFPGTTYLAGQGFSSHLDSDFRPFQGTGESLYLQGRERIASWLNACHLKPKVCGVSLGGSLALLLAVDIGNKVLRVDAFNPAGLLQPLWGSRKDNWERFTEEERPAVYVQKQANDIVSMFGDWKKEFILIHSKPPKEYQGSNGFSNHPINLAGFANTVYTTMDPEADNQQRKLRNLIFYNALRAAFYYTAIIPSVWLALPIMRLMIYLFKGMMDLSIAAAQLLYRGANVLGDAIVSGFCAFIDLLRYVTTVALQSTFAVLKKEPSQNNTQGNQGAVESPLCAHGLFAQPSEEEKSVDLEEAAYAYLAEV